MDSSPTETPPPATPTFLKLSYPAPRVLLVRMDRPTALNAMSTAAQWEMDSVWRWFDREPKLSVAVITGTGRAFSAGADLKEWDSSMAAGADPSRRMGNAPAFEPLSRRRGKKPVVAAVNGLAVGGGCEFVVNCDLVVAADDAYFALPEVKRGVAAIGGALPRLIRTVGLQRASELALTGRNVSAREMAAWGIVNKVVPGGDVVDEAVRYAAMIAANSPDAIICTRAGLRQGWEAASVEGAVERTLEREFAELQRGENILEGLRAFAEKREPRWKGSRL
ncbi:putative enoyl-CoA hydratase, mitochondrial [Colletotrichum tanaceti]|uniref:Putative enoyl-CoA hydratase, mitochondrial n=1 Tax=Colletotrichum tanaceti TaxID=1306861 RepID=A0A4U6XKF7_9PEZI|nr:putative enoyl-CoA hydratase, mitochondrial [Colletotrichum tanaceti]KAJ0167261.1 putative enoyl-CoA hydratase, mitochondrial [Colletotrichum tanaceti]TKW55077.1 putative enoyl-CoA hydratase, mitochondrial [Colletotrichum tanaceti]